MSSTGASAPGRRVMLVTRNFPPLLGGMEKFNARLFEELARSGPAAICGPEGCSAHVPAGVEAVEVRARGLGVFLARLAIAAFGLARRFRPDVVLAGSGLTAPLALAAARATGARYAVFVYGLDLVVKSRVYQALWMPAIRRADTILPISGYTRGVAIECGLDPSRMTTITPGVEMPRIDVAAAAGFRAQHGLTGKPILISIGRLTRRKGLVEFVERALPPIVRTMPDATLVVIGGEPVDALAGNRGGTTERVRAAAERLGIAKNVLLLGRCSDEVVDAALQASDVHVFPVIEIPGDVEGFGMVAIEAAAHGVPTVAFGVGGIPDAVSDGASGRLIAPGDYDAMAAAVLGYLDRVDRAPVRAACFAHARTFDWSLIGARLVQALSAAPTRPERGDG